MELDFQTGVAFGMLILALGYLVNRYVVIPLKKSSHDESCGPDCTCK
ncbi:MAG: hypothetical protein RLN81_15420 [Balneolaceae bacterium]